MKRYDLYKDSGVDWIGEIPCKWEVNRIKYLFDEKKSTKNSSLQCGSISFGQVIYKNDDKVPISTKESYQELLVGEFLINPLNLNYDLKSLRIGKSEIDVVVSQGYIILQSKTNHDSSYLNYLFREFDIKHMKSLGQGIRQTISFTHLKDEYLIVPPLSEQQQIVSFLDTKTSLIDSLIEKTQRKIELLKEKRTSLINEVVTKGLNPNVEMKDSGVEWIGEIPSHWERKRLKHVTISINGYSFKSDDFDKKYDIPVLRIGDVGDEIDFENCVKVKSHFLEEKKEFIVKKNDILIGLTGGTIGKSGKYNYDFSSLLNQRVGLLRNKDSVLNGLLYHYVKSEVFIRYIFFDCYGGGQDNISMNDILNMVFPYPPLPEQQQIVEYLDEQTQLIDNTISIEEKRIELLKEYRQSLISEVVTGKRKVVE